MWQWWNITEHIWVKIKLDVVKVIYLTKGIHQILLLKCNCSIKFQGQSQHELHLRLYQTHCNISLRTTASTESSLKNSLVNTDIPEDANNIMVEMFVQKRKQNSPPLCLLSTSLLETAFAFKSVCNYDTVSNHLVFISEWHICILYVIFGNKKDAVIIAGCWLPAPRLEIEHFSGQRVFVKGTVLCLQHKIHIIPHSAFIKIWTSIRENVSSPSLPWFRSLKPSPH